MYKYRSPVHLRRIDGIVILRYNNTVETVFSIAGKYPNIVGRNETHPLFSVNKALVKLQKQISSLYRADRYGDIPLRCGSNAIGLSAPIGRVFRMWRIREVETIMGKNDISETETRKLQAVGLEMVKYFDAVCRENQLTYFLCGGCCIGAVRNKGFIPWDDDVDVFMPREDYERLKNVWTDSAKYSIQFETQNIHTANQFITIHDNETTFIETYKKDLDINHGMKLDVLPLDGCPRGLRRKLQKLWALAYALFIVGKAPENHGKGVYGLGKLLLSMVPSKRLRARIWRLCETQMSKYPISACPYVTELCSGPRYLQMEYPAEVFSKQKYVPFENTFLPIPIGYDTYLTMAFGDYMTPPPPSQRVCHHEYECLDAEHSYRVYRGNRYFVPVK